MYNPDAYHYKIVWPIGVPPINTVYWDDLDWLRYAREFRPADYQGGETDKEAWLDYIDQKNLDNIRKNWPNHTVTLVGRDQFKLDKKEG